jgi:sugar/nucleoside kinase (ribokinase family)
MSHNLESIKILCIGEPCKEYVAIRRENGTLKNKRFTGFCGDVAPNVATYFALAAKELGLPCRVDILTAFGSVGEKYSDMAVKDIKKRGVKLHRYTKRLKGKRLGTVINLKNPDGTGADEKVRLRRRNSAFRDLFNSTTSAELQSIVKGYSYIIVSGIPLGCIRERDKLIELLQWTRDNQPATRIIVSTNLRPSNWQMPDKENPKGIPAENDAWKVKARHWMKKMLPTASIVFANFKDEKKVRGSKSPLQAGERLHRLSPNADIVVTNDEKPIHVFREQGKRLSVSRINIHPAIEVVDTVGGGDALLATSIVGQKTGDAFLQSVRRGSYVASQVVGFDGANPPKGVKVSFRPNKTVHRTSAGPRVVA